MLKLSKVEVTGCSCAFTLPSQNAHTDIGLLYHADVIAAIANGKHDSLKFVLHEFDNEGFLFGGGPTKDNRGAFLNQPDIEFNSFGIFLLHDSPYRGAFNNDPNLGLGILLQLLNNICCQLSHIRHAGPDVHDFKVPLDQIGQITDILCSL